LKPVQDYTMPYPAEHAARTRSRIVDSARRLFNQHGFEPVSIDQIMGEAGLTRGGFYHYFKSKDELYAAAVSSFQSCNPFRERVAGMKPSQHRPAKLARLLIDLYLSDEVLADSDQHCPLYALPSDVARAGLAPRQAYTDLIRSMSSVFTAALAGARDGKRRAQTIVSLCVGGMVLARTTNDAELRKSLRAAARHQALELLG
jgi:TetR/AcrR family transcriptional repressor of nem operon